MTSFLQDLRFGLRLLKKDIGFTLAIVLLLALGIGSISVLFSMVDGVIFRPLSGTNARGLISVYTSDYSGPQYGASSYRDYVDFRERTDAFDGLAAFTEIS